jgi:hypothetical protein
MSSEPFSLFIFLTDASTKISATCLIGTEIRLVLESNLDGRGRINHPVAAHLEAGHPEAGHPEAAHPEAAHPLHDRTKATPNAVRQVPHDICAVSIR